VAIDLFNFDPIQALLTEITKITEKDNELMMIYGVTTEALAVFYIIKHEKSSDAV
jgi:hypothetical protein